MAAQFITLTQEIPTGEQAPIRLNVQHIVSYWQFHNSPNRTAIKTTGQSQPVFVTQTVEQIDRLIQES